MISTFNALADDFVEATAESAIDTMVAENATVDIASIVGRINEIQTTVDKILQRLGDVESEEKRDFLDDGKIVDEEMREENES